MILRQIHFDMVWPPEVVDAVLRIESQTFVRRTEWFAEIGSTNDYALEVASQDDLVTPLLIWADRQTAGRGRNGNLWWAAAGALTFTLVVDAEDEGLTRADWPRLSLITGLAVAEAISAHAAGLPVGVKWPNDIHLCGRKVCGILIEPSPGPRPRLAIGIGINVSNSFRQAPEGLRAIATAISDHVAAPPVPTELLIEFLGRWSILVKRFLRRELDLVTEWRARCVLEGRSVIISLPEGQFVGKCQGIDGEGALLVASPTGVSRFVGGTVRPLLTPAG